MSESYIFEFQIDGKVTGRRLRRVLEAWTSAVFQLGRELQIDLSTENQVQSMSGGSAITSFEVDFPNQQSASLFVEQFDNVLLAASFHKNPFVESSPLWTVVNKMREAAKADSSEATEGLLWRNPSGDYEVNPVRDKALAIDPGIFEGPTTEESLGVISGVLQSLSARGGFRAVVYDFIFDRAVAFSIPEELRSDISEKWDKAVEVSGTIRRDNTTGRPLSMLDVIEINLIARSDNQWAWREARGVLGHVYDHLSAEEVIRRLRDE